MEEYRYGFGFNSHNVKTLPRTQTYFKDGFVKTVLEYITLKASLFSVEMQGLSGFFFFFFKVVLKGTSSLFWNS